MPISNITINEYITLKAIEHPSLYGARSFEAAKLAVLDHLLSTIGNGISFSDLLNDTFNNVKNKELLLQDSSYLFDGSPMYYVYRVNSSSFGYNSNVILNPKTGEQIFSLNMAQIKEFGFDDTSKYELSEIENSKHIWCPYPGFEKTYNILWNNKERIKELPNDFLEGFIDYYKTTLDFFTSDKQYHYHYACPAPQDETKWSSTLVEWQKIFEKNTDGIENLEDKYKKFSDDYGTSYDGDMRKFLENRHQNSMKKIVDFINETILLIENSIEEKNNLKPSSKPRKKM